MNKSLLAVASAAVMSLVSPSASAAEPVWLLSPTVYRVPGYNYELTGRDLNGVALNGDELTGRRISHVDLDGASLSGEGLRYAWLEGSELRALDSQGKKLVGSELMGVVFVAPLEDGGLVELRVDAVSEGTQKWDRDVFRYRVSYATTGGWASLCGDDEQGLEQMAIALEGRWDYGQGETGGAHVEDPWAFTFACEGRALAKCVEMGYKPWQTAMVCARGQGCAKTTLASVHQSCTRMLRADYCGDGTPHTADGMEVNAYDAYSIRSDVLTWQVEAEWGPDGAVCLAHQRMASDLPLECRARLERAECGNPDHFGLEVQLISEILP